MTTEERLEEAGLKSTKNNRKRVLKIAMDSAQELIALGNDPKMKNKILTLAKNHNDLIADAWSLYCSAEQKYHDYLEKKAKEMADKQESEIYGFYYEKINDEKENHREVTDSYSKLSKRLTNLVQEKTK